MENHQKYVFSICFAPWQDTFADAGDGDGGDHLGPLLDHFGTPYAKTKNNLKSISLKWHIIFFSPLFEKHHISPLFELKKRKACFREIQNVRNSKMVFKV